jgi:hypothetical protein
MKKQVTAIILSGAGFLFSTGTFAQDTLRKKSIDITSSFRPELEVAAKIAFNATPPTADTARPRLQYDIPDPSLQLVYQPGSLKPLALQIDTSAAFANSNYVKAGFGSLRTPFFQSGFTFGDGNTSGLNIYAKYLASDGKLDYQKFTSTHVKLSGFYKTAQNMEVNAAVGMKYDGTYKYGYEPKTLNFPDNDSIRQRFQTYYLRIGAHNVNPTEYGINYSPQIKIDVFGDHIKNRESNTVVDLPLEKTIGEDFAVNLALNFDLTRLSLDDKASTVNNTTWYVAPSVTYKHPNFRIQAGIRPSWDNKTFKMFPNILAEVSTSDQRFTFHAGWTGYIRKTTFQYLASQNPWLWAPSSLTNTWIEERFAGFKGSVGDHFSYNAKVGVNILNNQPLFINDTSAAGDGKSFLVVNERRINVLTTGGQIGYNVEEKFALIAGLSFNQFTGLKDNEKAWGMIPLELNASTRIQIIKDLWLKGDLFAWSGPKYLKKNGGVGDSGSAFDLNAGLEFRITKNLNLWTQFNNIFNKEYQRWNQYPVYGFNFVGGIIFSF